SLPESAAQWRASWLPRSLTARAPLALSSAASVPSLWRPDRTSLTDQLIQGLNYKCAVSPAVPIARGRRIFIGGQSDNHSEAGYCRNRLALGSRPDLPSLTFQQETRCLRTPVRSPGAAAPGSSVCSGPRKSICGRQTYRSLRIPLFPADDCHRRFTRLPSAA